MIVNLCYDVICTSMTWSIAKVLMKILKIILYCKSKIAYLKIRI